MKNKEQKFKVGDLVEWAGEVFEDGNRSGQLGIVTSAEVNQVSYLHDIFVQWVGGDQFWEAPSNLKLAAKA